MAEDKTPAQTLRDLVTSAADLAWAARILSQCANELRIKDPGREIALACTKLDEAEMWADRAKLA